jgi:hypothetical protein
MSHTAQSGDSDDRNKLSLSVRRKDKSIDTFLLEKDIFSNIFEKDIKRVYLYKKAERLAKAMSLMVPAFSSSSELSRRADRLSVALVDAAILPPRLARESLGRELLVLSSIISIGRVRGLVSSMNADLILREARLLLDEVAGYEEPRVVLPDVSTLPSLARQAASAPPHHTSKESHKGHKNSKGHVKDNRKKEGRANAILSVLKEKGPSDIRIISTLIRDVSEKTIQRELTHLVAQGLVIRSGTRRWTAYSLP